MPFCKSCGSPVEGQFCGKCGTPLSAPSAGGSTPQPPPGPQYSAPPQYGAAPQAAPAAGGLTDNVAGLLCYIPFLVGLVISIVFLVIDPYKQKKFVRFHAFQSIFFHVAMFAVGILGTIVGSMLSLISFSLSLLFSTLMMVVWVGALVVVVLLMLKANQGQMWQLPVIGPLAEKQS
jgi:uncharacterized membrane protein